LGPRRPTGVTLIVLWLGFEAFRSALALLAAVASLPAMQEADRRVREALDLVGSSDPSGVGITELLKWYVGPIPSLASGTIMLAGILFAMMLLDGALTYGIWTMSEQARRLAVVWFAVSALLILVSLALADSTPVPWQVVRAFVAVVSLVYLRRPEVRAAFRARWLPVRRS
jgi:hypothetical protein